MSRLTDGVLAVFDASQKAVANAFTQIEVGRVGRLLKRKEFSEAHGSEGNQVHSDQETPQPQAHSDHSDHIAANMVLQRIVAASPTRGMPINLRVSLLAQSRLRRQPMMDVAPARAASATRA